MADFVGLLKKTIDAQNNATPELRQRIYERARETVEKKLAASNVAPEIIELQRRIVEKAIHEVEELCREADQSVRLFLDEQEDEFDQPDMGAPDHSDDDRFVSGIADDAAAPPAANSRQGAAAASAGLGLKSATGFGRHQPETPAEAMFALPEHDYEAEYTADEGSDMQGHAAAAALIDNGEPDFIERTFPPALDALSEDSDAGPFSPFAENAPAAPGSSLYGTLADGTRKGAGVDPDDGDDVSLGRELLYGDDAPHSYQSYKARPVTYPPARREKDDESAYQSVPDFLMHEDEETAGGSPLPAYVPESPPHHLTQKAPLAQDFSAATAMPAAGTRVPVALAAAPDPAAEMSDAPQFVPITAADMPLGQGPLPPVGSADMQAPLQAKKRPRDTETADSATLRGPEAEKPPTAPGNDDFSMVSGIFAQAAIREKKRSGKKRLLIAGAIGVVILCIVAAIIWFLTDFLRKDEAQPHAAASEAALSDTVAREEPSAKMTQRLLPDGREINPGPAEGYVTPGEGTNTTTASVPPSQEAKALFYEAATGILPERTESGTVKWSLLRDKTADGMEEKAIRGDVTIPGKDMMLRMTIRRNADSSIPAVYLVELIFVVPENFDGEAVDRVGQLMFQASEQSAGQELQGTVPFKIDDNFFVFAMNAPKPFLSRNLSMMRQLPWMKLNIAYKNGRVGEFSLAKGETGDAIFKQVLDLNDESATPAADTKPAETQQPGGQP